MYAFSGAPYSSKIYDAAMTYSNSYNSFTMLWSEVSAAMDKGYTVSFGTKGSGDHNQKTTYGMAQSHAYQVVERRQCGTLYLFKLRNPWRSEVFITASHDATTKACIGADYNEINDGYIWVTNTIVTSDVDSYEISYLEYDWPVRYIKHVDSADAVMTIAINNPIVQDVIVQVDIDNERATTCTNGQSSRVLIGNSWKILQGGTANHVYKSMAVGVTNVKIDMSWAAGNTRRNLVIKTYAKQNVPFSLNSVAAKCYIFRDAIGNADFETNAASTDCAKRVPETYWAAANHAPGGGTIVLAPPATPPPTTTPTGNPGTATTTCEKTVLDALTATNAVTKKEVVNQYSYYYGTYTCNGATYLAIKYKGGKCAKVYATPTLTGSGAVGGGYVTNANCVITGDAKKCTLPMVTNDAFTGAAIKVTSGWGLSNSISYSILC